MKTEDIDAHHNACGAVRQLLRAVEMANEQDGSDEVAQGDEITIGKYKRLLGLGNSLTTLQDQWHQLLLVNAAVLISDLMDRAAFKASCEDLILQVIELEADVAHFSDQLSKEKGASTHQQWTGDSQGSYECHV